MAGVGPASQRGAAISQRYRQARGDLQLPGPRMQPHWLHRLKRHGVRVGGPSAGCSAGLERAHAFRAGQHRHRMGRHWWCHELYAAGKCERGRLGHATGWQCHFTRNDCAWHRQLSLPCGGLQWCRLRRMVCHGKRHCHWAAYLGARHQRAGLGERSVLRNQLDRSGQHGELRVAGERQWGWLGHGPLGRP